MKKTLFVFGLTAVLVFAFTATAMAASGLPDRSSAFLGGATDAYIAWDRAVSVATVSGVAATDMQHPHGGYLTTTIKCQVCHSAHKAGINGEKLLATHAADACFYCHGGASAAAQPKISAGNRHGGTEQCTNGYCHSLSPHGAWTSDYASLKSMLLNSNADPLIAAAILSNGDNLPHTATLDFGRGTNANAPVGLDGVGAANTIAVFNPGVTAAMMNNGDQTTNELARSVGTGYICANGGCHINGAFNSLTTDAYLGNVVGPAHKTTSRDEAIKGHILKNAPAQQVVETIAMGTSANGSTLTPTIVLSVDVAFAGTPRCNACHDAVDARIGGAKQFPHGNDNVDSSGNLVTYAGKTTTAAWFTLAPYFNGTKVNTNIRQPTGAGAYTVAMDGACLKCHRSSAGSGVGSTF